MHGVVLLLFLAIFQLMPSVSAWPSNLPSGWKVEEVVGGMKIMATDFGFLGNDPDRILVVSKKGQILLYNKGQRSVFLDLTDAVGPAFGDRGVLEIVVDPKFPIRPYIYVGYVYDNNPKNPQDLKVMRVSRFTATWDKADRKSEKILLGLCKDKEFGWYGHECMPMVGITHSSGWMGFDDNGNLYIGMGEGQTFDGADWVAAKQWTPLNFNGPMDPNFLGGKMLRVDPDTGYGLPDNPWYTGNPYHAASRVWSVGMRNPFKCGFVPKRKNDGHIICGNVGWYTYEGAIFNYKKSNGGWPCIENGPPAYKDNPSFPACVEWFAGRTKYPGSPPENFPVWWNHNGQSSAIIGGDFLGESFPDGWQDCWVYADFTSGDVRCLPWNQDAGKKTGEAPKLIMKSLKGPTTFRQGPDGSLYFLEMDLGSAKPGYLRRLIPAGFKPRTLVKPTTTTSSTTSTTTQTPILSPVYTKVTTVVPVVRNTTVLSSVGITKTVIIGNSTTLTVSFTPSNVVQQIVSSKATIVDATIMVTITTSTTTTTSTSTTSTLTRTTKTTKTTTTRTTRTTKTTSSTTTTDACFVRNRINVPDLTDGVYAVNYASDFLNVTYVRNGGFGPVEIDASVGGLQAMDGGQMRIGGVRHWKGFGTHSTSEISLNMNGGCYRFTAEVGVDDEVFDKCQSRGDCASIKNGTKALGEFILRKDNGTAAWNSSKIIGRPMRAGDAPVKVDIKNLVGVQSLSLNGYAPMGNTLVMDKWYNNLNWANAKLYCGPDAPYVPIVEITSPTPTNSVKLNSMVKFSGRATTWDGKPLPASALTWIIELLHCQGATCHTHPVLELEGVNGGTMQAADHPLAGGQYFFYAFKLIAVDDCGRADFASRALNVVYPPPPPLNTSTVLATTTVNDIAVTSVPVATASTLALTTVDIKSKPTTLKVTTVSVKTSTTKTTIKTTTKSASTVKTSSTKTTKVSTKAGGPALQDLPTLTEETLSTSEVTQEEPVATPNPEINVQNVPTIIVPTPGPERRPLELSQGNPAFLPPGPVVDAKYPLNAE